MRCTRVWTGRLWRTSECELNGADISLVWAYPANPQHQSPLDRLTAPYLQAFRLFMVLAIGSNVRTEHRTDAAMLRACAAAHFPAALRADLTVSEA